MAGGGGGEGREGEKVNSITDLVEPMKVYAIVDIDNRANNTFMCYALLDIFG